MSPPTQNVINGPHFDSLSTNAFFFPSFPSFAFSIASLWLLNTLNTLLNTRVVCGSLNIRSNPSGLPLI
jgi:hypothetical protein